MDTIDWEDAFQNGTYVENSDRYPELWAQEAAAFRLNVKCDLDIPYGEHARERFDLFYPDGMPKGLMVFIHGGYWLKFDKSFFSEAGTFRGSPRHP